MKFKDPKFGYHWIWIAPLAYAAITWYDVREWYKQLQLKRKIENRNPSEHKRLRILAGIQIDEKRD